MKKIVIDARGYQSTTGRYTRELIRNLEILEGKSKEREYVILLQKKEFEDYTPQAKNFSKLEADCPYYGLAEQINLLFFLNSLGADLVHFTMPQQPVFYRGKHVSSVHDLTLLKTNPGNKNHAIFKVKQLLGTFVFKRIAKTSEKILTISNFSKSEYLALTGIDPEKIVVTYPSAEMPVLKPTPCPPLLDKSFIMYVGQQSSYKNLRRLMQAHRQLLPSFPDLQLVFVGKPNAVGKKDRAWAEKEGFKNIIYTGFIDDNQLAWLYKHCQAYVFPSLMEGFGLPALEAMVYGAPVVSSNATCLPEVYEEAAHYFDPEDVDEMAEKIKDVLTKEKLRQKLIKNGQKQIKKYSWRRMSEQILEEYKNAL